LVPPKAIRRLVLAPFTVMLSLSLVVLFPLLGLALGLLGLASTRGFRALRLLCFAVIWLMAETTALFMCLGLWIASGFGGRRLRTETYRRRHYAVMRWFLDVLYRGAERTFGLCVEVSGPDDDSAEPARPVIVLSRHAGPGDSFLLVRHLLTGCGRRPRVVMKAGLQLDPGVDVVGNRLPNVFVRRRQAGDGVFTSQVARLAADLGDEDALVLFPEGGNWTPGRWRRGIRRLEAARRPDLAGRARRMPNLLPPRAGGTLAAIAACPAADVIFVAHAGLDRLVSAGDVWRHLPERQTVTARWWRVPTDSVPRSESHEMQELWLYDWWERIDAWITGNRPVVTPRP
jgi:1-acyl-sn-glycerol-3-phosphate acyltransferase